MSTANCHILCSEPYGDAALAKLAEAGEVSVLPACDERTLLSAVGACDALLIRTKTRVTRAVIERATKLRVIGRAGVGLDNIDLDFARERGMTVVHTPAASTDAVADLTIGLLLSVLRHIPTADRMVRGGEFATARDRSVGCELGSLTVGIIGMGRIGLAVARRCRNGFGSRILYNDIADVGPLDFEASPVSKDRLFAESDAVSLHVPLTDQTRHLIDAESLTRFPSHSILINTARGACVDASALAEALHAGTLRGAGLDVVDPEPLPADHALLAAPHTVLTPHIGARTSASLARMESVVDDVIRVLRGQSPRFPATP